MFNWTELSSSDIEISNDIIFSDSNQIINEGIFRKIIPVLVFTINKPSDISDKDFQNKLRTVINKNNNYDSELILKIYGAKTLEPPYKVITKSYKCLNDILKIYNNKLPLQKCKNFIIDILKSIIYIHEKGDYFGTINPNTIFFSSRGKLKLNTLSILFSEDSIYTAPEGKYTNNADMFGFGMTLYEMYFGSNSIKSDNFQDDKIKIIEGIRPSFDNSTKYSFIRQIIQSCWSVNPNKRPNPSKILELINCISTKEYNIENILQKIDKPEFVQAIPIISLVPVSTSENNKKQKVVPNINYENNLIIPYEELKIENRLGVGCMGLVHKGIYKEQYVAIKKLFNCGNIKVGDKIRDISFYVNREMKMLSEISHPNIIKLIGFSLDSSDQLCIITELMDQNLHSLLLNTKIKLTIKDQIQFLYQISCAMNYLHSVLNIMHRDLKSDNILLDKHYNIKLCDMGMSRDVNVQDSEMTACGSPGWMAPEMLLGLKYSYPADVFSFSCIIYEVFSRSSYAIPRRILNQYKIDFDRVRKRLPDDLPIDIWHLLCKCGDFEPEKRPTFQNIEHILKIL